MAGGGTCGPNDVNSNKRARTGAVLVALQCWRVLHAFGTGTLDRSLLDAAVGSSASRGLLDTRPLFSELLRNMNSAEPISRGATMHSMMNDADGENGERTPTIYRGGRAGSTTVCHNTAVSNQHTLAASHQR